MSRAKKKQISQATFGIKEGTGGRMDMVLEVLQITEDGKRSQWICKGNKYIMPVNPKGPDDNLLSCQRCGSLGHPEGAFPHYCRSGAGAGSFIIIQS